MTPVIHARPEILGTTAGRPSGNRSTAVIVPTNSDPITDRIRSWSPVPASPRACRTASRADTPVPVGERSSLPGSITEVLCSTRPSSSSAGTPAIWQNEMCAHSGLVGWRNPSCSFAAAVTRAPTSASSAAADGSTRRPRSAASTRTKLSPPNAVSTRISPTPGTSSRASRWSTNEGRFRTSIRSALPSRQRAVTSTRPPGASITNRVTGSIIGTRPVSSSTVATHIELLPDIGGCDTAP